MKKIVFSILIALTLCIGFAFADEYEAEYPKIVFENKLDITKVKAGDNFEVNIIVKNVGNEAAKYVNIANSDKDAPIYWETAVDTYSINRMSSGSKKELKLNLCVKETADVGIYELPFDITYSNYSGNQYTNKQTLYFEVTEEKSKPLMELKNIKTNPSEVVANSEVKLSFDLFNSGDLLARRVKLTLDGTGKSTFMVKDAIDTRYFDLLDGQESRQVEFDLLVSEDIEEGTHELNVKLEYFDQDNKSYSDTKTFYINNVKGISGTSSKSSPKIIISSYIASPSTVVAGKDVKLTFKLKNTHNSKAIVNMKSVIDTDGTTLSMAGGSNSFYIERLEPQQEIEKTITLKTKQDALSKAYPINITSDYEDEKGTSYNAVETINLPVLEKTNLSINNIYGPYEMYKGNTGYVSFEYYNMGKATISNLRVTVEGDYSPVGEVYIGNVDAGKGSYSEIEVRAEGAEQAHGKLIFSFEDSSGNVLTETRSIEGFIYTEQSTFNEEPIFMPDIMVEQPKDNMAWWLVGLISAGAFALVMLVTRAIVIKIGMKKIEEEI